MWMHARHPLVGAGPGAGSLVLVHGLGVSSRYMLPTLALLARSWDVVAPDLPGFGLSERPRRPLTLVGLADSLVAWMSLTDRSHAVLLGNSVGCQVISTLASRAPDRVRAAVLVAPTMDPSAGSAPRLLARLLLDGPRERPSELPLDLGDYRRAGVGGIWRTFQDAARAPVFDQLRAMAMPTLVVRGSRDPIVSAAWSRQVSELLPDGRLAIVQGAPHAVNYSAPEGLVAVVEPFLRGLPR